MASLPTRRLALLHDVRIDALRTDTRVAHWDPDLDELFFARKNTVDPIDHFGMVPGDVVTDAVATANNVAEQAMFDECRGKYAIKYPGESDGLIFRRLGTVYVPGPQLIGGCGIGRTIIKPQPSFNGALYTNPLDGQGAKIDVPDVTWAHIEYDGDVENNVVFTTTLTFTAPALFASNGTDVVVDGWPSKQLASVPVDFGGHTFPSSGEMVRQFPLGGNTMYMSWTGKTGTTGAGTLTGVTFIAQSNSTPVDVDSGEVFRLYIGGAGIFRFYGFHRMSFLHGKAFDCPGYVGGFGGRAYDADKGLAKSDLYMLNWDWGRSIGADCVDLKSNAGVLAERSRFHDGHDKGFNGRGGRAVFIDCYGYDNHASNLTWANTSSVSPQPAFELTVPITKAPGQTVTVPTDYRASMPISGIATIGTERRHFTYDTGTGVATFDLVGQEGTVALDWPASTGGAPVWVRFDVAEDPVDDSLRQDSPAVCVIGGEWLRADGSGMHFAGSGTGILTFEVLGAYCADNAAYAIMVSSSKGRVEGRIDVVGKNNAGGGVYAHAAERLSIGGELVHNGHGTNGSGVEAVHMGNGIVLESSLDIRDSAGYGLDAKTTGNTRRIHWDGYIRRTAGLLGMYRVRDDAILSGSGFGRRTPMYFPGRAQESVTLNAATGEITLDDGRLWIVVLECGGPLKIAAHGLWVTTGSNTPTAVQSVTALMDGLNFTALTRSAIQSGGSSLLAGTAGEKRIGINTPGWVEMAEFIGLGIVQVGATGAGRPKIAAQVPAKVALVSGWRPVLSGYMDGVTTSGIPDTGTLTRDDSVIPYLFHASRT